MVPTVSSGLRLHVGSRWLLGPPRLLWRFPLLSLLRRGKRLRSCSSSSALGVDVFRGGLCPPLYIRGDRVTWKVLAECSWSLTTTRLGSFLCTVASSTPIRVVTREVRYTHDLSLILEHSMPISSPTAPGLTRPRALRSRVLQASSTWLGVFEHFQ